MRYQNAELHNVAEIIRHQDGGITWKRIPAHVCQILEFDQGRRMAHCATGVELRFVLKGDRAVIKMCTTQEDGFFHVFRGGIQGGWADHEVHKQVGTRVEEYVIERSPNPEHLAKMSEKSGSPWDPQVIRIIFDRGYFKLYDIIGDIEPPTTAQLPKRTLLAYGSSITHGSNSIDMSHTWVSILAHRLGMDARNLGMAGSCAMEPEMIDYIAAEGQKGLWDMAILELGINVLDWEETKIFDRVDYTLRQIAGGNPDKRVVVISPFYYCGDDFDQFSQGRKWRKCIRQAVDRLSYPNVTYINGLELLDHISLMSADEVHPNIYGVQQIADRLSAILADDWCAG